VPTQEALRTLSSDRTSTRFMYNGPNAHAITYPVTKDLLNVLLVISDPNPWETEDGRHIARGRKQEALDAFADWHPTVRAVVDLMPEEMDKWAIFDMMEHPAPFYARGRVCVAGDAAHAAGPHLGAGAGFGMEDALVLAELLRTVNEASDQRFRAQMCRDLLRVYNDERYDRTQWLVRQTRVACDLFQWRDPDVGSDSEKFSREITRIFHHIWTFDIEGSAKDAVRILREAALSGVKKN
jgi:salicylate hydroxylase